MGAFFSSPGNLGDELEIAKLLKQRTDTLLDGLIQGDFDRNQLTKYDLDLLLFYDPKKYIGEQSEEINFVRTHENVIASMGRWLGYDPANFSTLRFFQTLELIKASQPKQIQQ